MAARRPVLVTVSAAEAGSGEEPMRVQIRGTAEDQAQDVILRYTEHLTDDGGAMTEPTDVTLRVRGGHAVMQRRGSFSAMMVFEPGQWRESAYHTPYGDLPMAVRAGAVELTRAGDGGALRLEYELSVQGSPLSRRVLTLTWRDCAPC